MDYFISDAESLSMVWSKIISFGKGLHKTRGCNSFSFIRLSLSLMSLQTFKTLMSKREIAPNDSHLFIAQWFLTHLRTVIHEYKVVN